MIEVNNLSFSYCKNKKVLDNISCKLTEGKCIIVLGPNGAGKSTFLKCLVGINKIDTGKVVIENKDIFSISNNERAKLISFVPQNPSFTDTTVFDAILVGRKPYITFKESKEDLEIVSNIITKMDLSLKTIENVETLSGGQIQKVAIARALAQDTKVIYFDEPTSNLDIKSQYEIMDIIYSLTKENKLVIINMHDLNLAINYADEIILMKDGKIIKHTKEITEEDIKLLYGVDVDIIHNNNQKIITMKGK